MNSKFLIFLISCLYFPFSYSAAQSSLKGLVSNDENNPLSYTFISLNKEGSAPIVMQADSIGRFDFKNLLQGNYTLSAYALGYTKLALSLKIRKDTFIHIILQPLEGSLKEVTVTGAKPVIERKADRIIYHVANSVNAAGSNGLDILKKAPGLKITDNAVSLAGKGSLGIMINGRLLHLSDKALVNYLKSFSANQISKIEIITHPSAQYDAEGNAGLVNIVTKLNATDGFSGEASGSVSRFFYKNQPNYKGIKNYGDLDAGVGLNYNYNKWSIYTNIGYTAGRELWGYGIDVFYPEKHWAMKDTGEYRISTLNWLSGIDYKLSANSTLGFEYNYNRHVEEGADYVRVPVYNTIGKLDSTLKTYATYYPIAQINAFNLHFIQNLNQSGAKLTLNGDYFNSYRTDKSHSITQSFTEEGKLKEDKTKRLYDTTLQNIRIYTFKADADIPTSFAEFSLGSKISFINNYSNIYYYHNNDGELTLDQELSNEFRYIENTQALYFNGAKEEGRWKLTAGLRSEFTQTKAISYFSNKQVNKHYLKLFPSVLASYKVNTNNVFSFSYNKRIHRPTFWNLNPFKSFMSAYTYVEGNPYLEPEYLTNIELSHICKGQLTSSIYMNVINNGFAQVTHTNDTGYYIHTTSMFNFISAYRYGISESLSIRPFRWMETTNQVNAYYTQANSNLSYIKGINRPGLYLETNNTFFFNKDKTIRGAIDFWCQFPEIDHFGKSDTYYNLDIGMQILTMQKRLTISLHATDLLQSSGSIVHTTVNNIKNTFTNFQIYRQAKLSVSWQFGKSKIKHTPVNTGNEEEKNRLN